MTDQNCKLNLEKVGMAAQHNKDNALKILLTIAECPQKVANLDNDGTHKKCSCSKKMSKRVHDKICMAKQ